jgi:hypothetical protein
MSFCQRCDTNFECGMRDAKASQEPCWCTRLPALPRAAYTSDEKDTAQCLCPDCLRALLNNFNGTE